MAPPVLLIAEAPPSSELRVDCPRDDGEGGQIEQMKILHLPSPLPDWLVGPAEGLGLQPAPVSRHKPSVASTGVLVQGALRLSLRGVVFYDGRLTRWPSHARLLWETYHKPMDAVSISVAQAWRLAEPLLLHHRRTPDRLNKDSFGRLTAVMKSQLFDPYLPAFRDARLQGVDGTDLHQILAAWGVEGLPLVLLVPPGVATLLVNGCLRRIQLMKRYTLFNNIGLNLPEGWADAARPLHLTDLLFFCKFSKELRARSKKAATRTATTTTTPSNNESNRQHQNTKQRRTTTR